MEKAKKFSILILLKSLYQILKALFFGWSFGTNFVVYSMWLAVFNVLANLSESPSQSIGDLFLLTLIVTPHVGGFTYLGLRGVMEKHVKYSVYGGYTTEGGAWGSDIYDEESITGIPAQIYGVIRLLMALLTAFAAFSVFIELDGIF